MLTQFPAVASLTYPIIKKPSFKVGIVEYCDGAEQRIINLDESKYYIEVRYKIMTLADLTSILDFFVARRGAYEEFYWTDPNTSISHIVRFAEDESEFELFFYNLYNFNQINFVETLERT